jgi:hypothetical protein
MDADIEDALRALNGLETTAVNDFQWLTRVRANWKMMLEELQRLRDVNRNHLSFCPDCNKWYPVREDHQCVIPKCWQCGFTSGSNTACGTCRVLNLVRSK